MTTLPELLELDDDEDEELEDELLLEALDEPLLDELKEDELLDAAALDVVAAALVNVPPLLDVADELEVLELVIDDELAVDAALELTAEVEAEEVEGGRGSSTADAAQPDAPSAARHSTMSRRRDTRSYSSASGGGLRRRRSAASRTVTWRSWLRDTSRKVSSSSVGTIFKASEGSQ